MHEIERQAQCSCGALRVLCRGEPVRISMCHCIACQRRTGVVFSTQSRYPCDQVRVQGESRVYTRTADSGNTVSSHFCGACGSTVYWELSGFPDLIAVATGMFADPSFPAPRISVHESTRHAWTADIAACEMQHQR